MTKLALDVGKIKNLYERGWPLRKIARELGTTHRTIKKRLIQLNCIPKPITYKDVAKKNVSVEELLEMRNSGKSFNQISLLIGSSPTHICNRIKKFVSSNYRVNPFTDSKCVAEMYLDGYNVKSICEKFNISLETCYKKLKQKGIKTAGHVGYGDKYTDRIIQLYSTGKTCKHVAQEIGVSIGTVVRRLNKNNIPIRKYRKYSVKENFFSIYTKESCYWAGFVAADGCITNNNRSFRFSLGIKDRDHLIKLMKSLEYSGKLYEAENKVDLLITSAELTSDLINNFNITPRKTFSLLPPLIPKNMINHYVRGYMDGDGCFSVNAKKHKYSISVVGSGKIITWIKHLFQNECNAGNPSIRPAGNVYSVAFNGRLQFNKISNWIYKDSSENIRMNRKYLKSLLGKEKDNKVADEEQVVIDLYLNGHSIKYIEKNTKFKYRRTRRILTDAGIKKENPHAYKLTNDEISHIILLRKGDKTIKQISAISGIGAPIISEFLKRVEV